MRYGNGGSNIEIGKARFHHDGVITEIKQINFGAGGQNVRVFNSAVEWTYSASETHDASLGLSSYGNDAHFSAFIAGGGNTDNVNGHGTCTVVYTFNEPLLLKAGQTISIRSLSGDYGTTSVTLNDDSSPIDSWAGNNDMVTNIYTVPSDVSISKVTVKAYIAVAIHNDDKCDCSVTINSDVGSFLLNDSGTSDGQT